VSGNNISANTVAEILEINRKTAQRAKRKRLHYESSNGSVLFLTPPTISRLRLPPIFAILVEEWIESHTVPSSKVGNIVTYEDNGITKTHQLHYRTTSIDDMYQNFLQDHPNFKISSSYFYSHLPQWLCMKAQRSGLCIYHDKAVRLVRILMSHRLQWHTNCTCTCSYCR
jgi:hypothetical protein